MAARDCIIDVCDALGLPIAKFEGAPSLVFVGTGIDTTFMRAFFPPERVAYTIELLHTWLPKKTRTRARNTIPRGTIVLRGTSRSVG